VNISIRAAGPKDADTIAEMVGELLGEIMQAIGVQAFHFDRSETRERAKKFMERGIYSVFIASDTSKNIDIGLAALYESHALYAEGAFGTIPEFYVRPAFRSKGIGKMLLESTRKYGISKGWKRLEVATPPVPVFDRTLKFYEANGFTSTGGQKLKVAL
jgi:GNAT superfamily N-acetyltransferase